MYNKLTPDLLCGFTPRTVYNKCCESFSFNPSHIRLLINLNQDNLGNLIETDSMKSINLKKVTPEKYDVWFISQNNWTRKTGEPSVVIAGNYSWITEKKFAGKSKDLTPRLVFAKNPSKYDAYTFLGIFKPSLITDTTRHYTQISAKEAA